MTDSKDLLIIFGVGILTLGIVAIAYFAFLSSQRINTAQTATYVQVPSALRGS